MITVKVFVDNKEIESIDLNDGNHKGWWISHYDEDAKVGWYECSCCHSERAFNTNFCPDCGANMREPQKVLDNRLVREALDEPKGEKEETLKEDLENLIKENERLRNALFGNKGDLISKQAVLDELEKWDWQDLYLPSHFKQILDNAVLAENVGEWIPVKWHEITDEEREREKYPKDWACHLDSVMPYDGQQILITTKSGFVELDEGIYDGCTFALDSGYDWVDDVIAWMPLPEPYKAEGVSK